MRISNCREDVPFLSLSFSRQREKKFVSKLIKVQLRFKKALCSATVPGRLVSSSSRRTKPPRIDVAKAELAARSRLYLRGIHFYPPIGRAALRQRTNADKEIAANGKSVCYLGNAIAFEKVRDGMYLSCRANDRTLLYRCGYANNPPRSEQEILLHLSRQRR